MMKLGIDYGLGTINDGLPTTDTEQVVGAMVYQQLSKAGEISRKQRPYRSLKLDGILKS
ncbi:hypothetical protein [Coleofasciculus sp. FACHB-SPT9]|uniref:hypothetical protein n=1 Tax=Cyanophyceae TaxID=3028117 RepID=UPI001681E125|nr:hypothetical protein [Coleofasciculus sp. FACHB-SPT9]MBD1891264.1 hypothetical protein [Coleofasciculus sp. FACHB-SPT9]